MSNHPIPSQAPEGAAKNGSTKAPAYLLGALAGAGLLLLLPGQARADGYGHAEITLGFPHGQVTVGKTWDDNPRRVVVEEVTHKVPDPDFEYDDEKDGEAAYDGDADEPDVVIEKRVRRPRVRHVTVIERYEEPVRCDREVVVRHVYVEPRYCERPNVVIYRNPSPRVIYAPSRTVIVAPGRGGSRHVERHGDYGTRSYDRGGGPRNLFPEDSGRPARTRGVQQRMVKVGG